MPWRRYLEETQRGYGALDIRTCGVNGLVNCIISIISFNIATYSPAQRNISGMMI